MEAHNKTADEYNNGKIAEYNKKHSPDSKNYLKNYEKQFNKDWSKNFAKMQVQYMNNDANFKKAQKLLDKYDLTKVSDLARDNATAIAQLKRDMEG